MGSAAMKPLGRRHGKNKVNEVSIGDGNVNENKVSVHQEKRTSANIFTHEDGTGCFPFRSRSSRHIKFSKSRSKGMPSYDTTVVSECDSDVQVSGRTSKLSTSPNRHCVMHLFPDQIGKSQITELHEQFRDDVLPPLTTNQSKVQPVRPNPPLTHVLPTSTCLPKIHSKQRSLHNIPETLSNLSSRGGQSNNISQTAPLSSQSSSRLNTLLVDIPTSPENTSTFCALDKHDKRIKTISVSSSNFNISDQHIENENSQSGRTSKTENQDHNEGGLPPNNDNESIEPLEDIPETSISEFPTKDSSRRVIFIEDFKPASQTNICQLPQIGLLPKLGKDSTVTSTFHMGDSVNTETPAKCSDDVLGALKEKSLCNSSTKDVTDQHSEFGQTPVEETKEESKQLRQGRQDVQKVEQGGGDAAPEEEKAAKIEEVTKSVLDEVVESAICGKLPPPLLASRPPLPPPGPVRLPMSLNKEDMKRQTFEEGLSPAASDGGVSFFVPVSESGLQPNSSATNVLERITKPKRSQLKPEEKMMMANINRQIQISKRKNFALKDIAKAREVLSATSSRTELHTSRSEHKRKPQSRFDDDELDREFGL